MKKYEREMGDSMEALKLGDEEKCIRVKEIHEMIGYEFNDPILLEQAFTHYSYEEGCLSLERLAYTGDAILSFGVTKDQSLLYPDLDRGSLTRLRAVNVDTEKLARVALKYNLHTFLRHNIYWLPDQIKGFKEEVAKHPLHSGGVIDAPKVLADIVEALIGAIFTDSKLSLDTTWEVVKKMLEPMITPATLPTHPVTQLLELCQQRKLNWKIRDTWDKDGVIEFLIHDQPLGSAQYKSKRAIAKNQAALVAYNHLLTNFQTSNQPI